MFSILFLAFLFPQIQFFHSLSFRWYIFGRIFFYSEFVETVQNATTTTFGSTCAYRKLSTQKKIRNTLSTYEN